MLVQLGCRVDVAEHGNQAVEKFLAAIDDPYDLVLMDCQMPVMDGYEATRRLRAAQAEGRTPVVALTAHAFAGEREKCLAAGMDDFLTKPVRPEPLRKMLARWLPAPPPAECVAPEVEFAPPDEIEKVHAVLGRGFASLVDLFLADTPRRLAALRAAAEQGDVTVLAKEAHALAGSAVSLGAGSLAIACRALEIDCQRGRASAAALHIAAIERTYADVAARLLHITRSGSADQAEAAA
jgi:CheY-like chemotaxis protein/HPt (histidine-containing phosphotransfer) domain-containing protein